MKKIFLLLFALICTGIVRADNSAQRLDSIIYYSWQNDSWVLSKTEYFYSSSTSAIFNTECIIPATKIIRNGIILIQKGGKTYTLTGANVQ